MIKKYFFLCQFVLLLGCSHSETKDFIHYKWSSNGKLGIENGDFNSPARFDKATGEMVGDTLFPIQVLDSSLIITRKVAHGERDDEYTLIPDRDTIRIDTFHYDIRNFLGTKLSLYKEIYKDNYFIESYKLGEDVDIPEARTLSNPSFLLAGLTIGDTINRDIIRVKLVTNVGGYSIEHVVLRYDEDIELEIIENKYIYGIQQSNISPNDFADVRDVVTHKMGVEPVYSEKEDWRENETESYSWEKYGVRIYAIGMTYTGNDRYMNKREHWTLFYSDRITQSLLNLEFQNEVPKSRIIK